MGIFGSAPEFLKTQFRRQLVVGTVIKLEELMDDGNVKPKRFVLVHVGAKLSCFVINTAISQFVQSRPAMLKCQALMEHATHPFMSWDSYIDCFRPKVYDMDHVLAELVNQTGSILGKITRPMRDEIVLKLLQSSATSPLEKTTFAASLKAML